MPTHQLTPAIALWCCFTFTIACSKPSHKSTQAVHQQKKSQPLQTLTTFYPTQYFAQRIAGDLAEVICPLPDDADPIFWMPDPTTIQRYQQADLIILNGAGFEKWVQVVSLPDSKMVDTASTLPDPLIRYENATVHQHGPEGNEHTHEGIDGHTWPDPINAKAQATVIRDAFLKRLPKQKQQKAINQAYQRLAKDLDQLDAAFRSLKLPPVLCSHPAYNYLARRYSWTIHNLDLDPDSPLSKEALANIQSILKNFPAKHLLWEGTPQTVTSRQLSADLGLQSLTISPCELLSKADQTEGLDYLSVMQANANALQAISQ